MMHMSTRYKYLALVVMAACAQMAQAGDGAADKAPDLVLHVPRVDVIGNQETWFATPGSAVVVSEEELETSRVMTTNEALRKVPGLVTRDEEGFAMRPNIGIRGLNPTRSTKILLLEDGIPLAYAPYGDNASYYYPTIDRFSSIEVLKGAGQIKFGPQTMGGVINHITPNAPERFGGHLGVTAGNRDYLNTKVNVGGNDMLLDYTHKEGDGARDRTHHSVDDLNYKVTKALGDDHAVTLRANYFREDSQVSYTGLTLAEYNNFGGEYNPFKHDDFDLVRYGTSLTHDWQINTNVLLTTNVYYSYFDRDWWRQQSNSTASNIASGTGCAAVGTGRIAGLAVDADTCQGNQGRLRTYNTYGVEPRLTVTHTLGKLEMGARAHFEDQERRQKNGTSPTARTGTLSENNHRETDAYSGFVSNRFDIGNFSITPAVRYEHVENKRKNRLTGAGGEATLHEWVPGISFAYTPNAQYTVYAGVHEGFAPPQNRGSNLRHWWFRGCGCGKIHQL
jgi:Fe(3+) dicitrate transport protein